MPHHHIHTCVTEQFRDLGDAYAALQSIGEGTEKALLLLQGRWFVVLFGPLQKQVASLDHALWFHKPSDASHWHLYVQDSPSASGGRGFNRGSIFTREGVLVASAAQEALIRYRE